MVNLAQEFLSLLQKSHFQKNIHFNYQKLPKLIYFDLVENFRYSEEKFGRIIKRILLIEERTFLKFLFREIAKKEIINVQWSCANKR